MNEVSIIDRQSDWDAVAAQLGGERELAVDLEANSLHAYRERICLIQIATDRASYIVDPLAVDDLSRLGEILGNAEIVKDGHGCDYDIRSLDRDYQFSIRGLFDTQIAARFLGCRTPNLGAVLADFLNVSIPKSRELQRSNWARRPLRPAALEYAANDVNHLVRLSDTLRERLREVERLEWVEEECHRLTQTRFTRPGPAEFAFLRVKGSDRLDGRELAILKELHGWRERLAERQDRPAFQIAGNDDLIQSSLVAAQHGTADLGLVALMTECGPSLGPHLSAGVDSTIINAARRGLDSPPFVKPERPRRFNPWTPDGKALLQSLKRRRTEIGAALDLDPALIWPAPSLERMALAPEEWRIEIEEGGAAEVRAWQRREFGDRWQDVVETHGREGQ